MSEPTDCDPWLYSGKRLRHLDFPLGGIGTGNILLQGDGSLRGWDIQNQFHSAKHRPLHNLPLLNSSGGNGNCWAISACYNDDGKESSRQSYLLRSANHHGVGENEDTQLHGSSNHDSRIRGNNNNNNNNNNKPPEVPEVSVRARYPIADVSYQTPPSFPVSNIQMEAMTPLVPNDVKASGMPMAVFVLSFENSHPTKSVSVDVMQSTLNFIGWDGGKSMDSKAANHKRNKTSESPCIWGGNINEAFWYSTDDSPAPPDTTSNDTTHVCKGLFLHTKNELKEDLTRKGSIALSAVYRDNSERKSALSESSPTVTVIKGVTSEEDLFAKFRYREFEEIDSNNDANNVTPPSRKGTTYAGAVIQSLTVPPNASARVTFCLSWHFPYRPSTVARTNLPPDFFGNWYAKWCTHAKNVATQFCDNLSGKTMTRKSYKIGKPKNMVELTRLFVESLYGSTIPWSVLESATSKLAIPRSPTMFRTEAGIVLGNVGNDQGPINATHVYGYTTLLEKIFPAMSKDMMVSTFVRNFDLGSGGCQISFGQGGFAIDGALACVIQVYLVVKQSDPGLEFLSQVWPNIKRQMASILDKKQHFDVREGIITGPQITTYGGPMEGANTLVGSYLVTALKATEAMANLMGDVNFAKKCSEQVPISRDGYESHCWNETFGYYVAEVNQNNCQNSYGTGCFIDQLVGASLSRACGFGNVFDPNREARARTTIVQNNLVSNPSFRDEDSNLCAGDSGIRVCTYPNGKLGDGISFSDRVASGSEYSLAAGLIDDGNWQDALKVCSFARTRQSGLHKSPWNESEMGLYSARSMSAWNLFDQACGHNYDSTRAAIGFLPRINSDQFSCFCTFGGGFGEFQQRTTCKTGKFASGNASLKVFYGAIELKSIHLNTSAHVVAVSLDGQSINASIDPNGLVAFDDKITIGEDSTLSLTLSSPCLTKKRPIYAAAKESKMPISSYVNKRYNQQYTTRERIRYLGILCVGISILYWWIFCLPLLQQSYTLNRVET